MERLDLIRCGFNDSFMFPHDVRDYSISLDDKEWSAGNKVLPMDEFFAPFKKGNTYSDIDSHIFDLVENKNSKEIESILDRFFIDERGEFRKQLERYDSRERYEKYKKAIREWDKLILGQMKMFFTSVFFDSIELYCYNLRKIIKKDYEWRTSGSRAFILIEEKDISELDEKDSLTLVYCGVDTHTLTRELKFNIKSFVRSYCGVYGYIYKNKNGEVEIGGLPEHMLPDESTLNNGEGVMVYKKEKFLSFNDEEFNNGISIKKIPENDKVLFNIGVII